MAAADIVPYTTELDRRPRKRCCEPPEVLEARTRLASSTSVEDRHFWGKQLFRRKRRWLNFLASERFRETALALPRRSSNRARVSWIRDSQGNPCRDQTLWGDHVSNFFNSLYSPSMETAAQKQCRLA